jgi:hypothetical protein
MMGAPAAPFPLFSLLHIFNPSLSLFFFFWWGEKIDYTLKEVKSHYNTLEG